MTTETFYFHYVHEKEKGASNSSMGFNGIPTYFNNNIKMKKDSGLN